MESPVRAHLQRIQKLVHFDCVERSPKHRTACTAVLHAAKPTAQPEAQPAAQPAALAENQTRNFAQTVKCVFLPPVKPAMQRHVASDRDELILTILVIV